VAYRYAIVSQVFRNWLELTNNWRGSTHPGTKRTTHLSFDRWNKEAIAPQPVSGGKSERMRNSANTGTFIRLYFDFLSRFLRLDFLNSTGLNEHRSAHFID
jgi:hypothetical protein